MWPKNKQEGSPHHFDNQPSLETTRKSFRNQILLKKKNKHKIETLIWKGSGSHITAPRLYQEDCVCVCSVIQSCLTVCDPMDCSLPGSYVHGIFQAKILEWVAISYSRRSSWPRDPNLCLLHFLYWQADYLPLGHLGNEEDPGGPKSCIIINCYQL